MLFSIRSWQPLLASFAVVLSLAWGAFAQAAEAPQCDCWCGKAGVGAQTLAGAEKQADPAACATACREKGLRLVGCFAAGSANTPPKDDKCWEEKLCTDQGAGYEFSGKQFDCPPNMGYCYAPPRVAIQLNASIGGVSQLSTLQEYVGLVYRVLLGVGALVSVVLVIVAGFQWMTSRGNAGNVEKAKERIEAVVVGTILLFGAYVIARTIDPRLVAGNPLRIPQLKTIELLSGATSCEKLEASGYVIEELDGGRNCGKAGKVTDASRVAGDVQSNIDVGATCRFIGCAGPDAGKSCIVASGVASCVSCAEVGSAVTSKVSASTAVCADIQRQQEEVNANKLIAADGDVGNLYRCFYEDNWLNSCVALYTTNDYVNCPALREQAKSASDPCDLYEAVSYASGALNNFNPSAAFDTSDMEGQFAQFCSSDPCGLAKERGAKGCTYSGSTSFDAEEAAGAGAVGGAVIGGPVGGAVGAGGALLANQVLNFAGGMGCTTIVQ